MNSILITGCNRGLGLGIVKALINSGKQPKHIFATCRSLEKATELKELAEKCDNIHILEIDLKNVGDYDKIVCKIDSITKDEGLNVLFNNAGVAPTQRRLTHLKEQDLIDALATNTIAPIMFTQACLPLIKKAALYNESKEMGIEKAAILNMSSMLGSIEANDSGGLYAYRTSKTALNAATKSMSIDLCQDKILCVALHPGWVRTDMGGKNAPLRVEDSTIKLIETISNFDASHNGGFYQYDGKKLPW